MNIWNNVVAFFDNYATRIIGFALFCITTAQTQSLIPPDQLKYWLYTIAVLTYVRGQVTGQTYQQAKTYVQQVAAAADPAKVVVPPVIASKTQEPQK